WCSSSKNNIMLCFWTFSIYYNLLDYIIVEVYCTSVMTLPFLFSLDEDYEPPTKATKQTAPTPALISRSRRGRPPGSSPPSKKRSQKQNISAPSEEENDWWHNREEEDITPHLPRFMPARTPGPNIDTSKNWSPLSLFHLFFFNNTNANTARKKAGGMVFKWEDLTMKDCYIFLSIILFMGLVSVPQRSNYWRARWPYNFRFPRKSMTRDRFEAIMWSSFFQPYQHVSIDERMVATKARISMKQYIKDKPKWVTNFLCWQILRQCPPQPMVWATLLSWTLCLQICLVVTTNYTDNFEKKSCWLPTDCAFFGRSLFSEGGHAVDAQWQTCQVMDTREVATCSTIHKADTGQTVKREVKQAGLWQTKNIPVLDCIVDYNANMGGVDPFDVLIGYYNKLNDIAVVNSFLLHKELFKQRQDRTQTEPLTQKVFREQLAAGIPKPPTKCVPGYDGDGRIRKHCKWCLEQGIPRVKTPV
uniref:PiggyBac transposable element-derived protein domain-containing protein n=1 Tax=Periophthalmus magnuspinnatus TaxID=409849 RepID=A0A3B3ZMU6_9GOBI